MKIIPEHSSSNPQSKPGKTILNLNLEEAVLQLLPPISKVNSITIFTSHAGVACALLFPLRLSNAWYFEHTVYMCLCFFSSSVVSAKSLLSL